MSDWTEGYVADLDYTFGYYTELNPLRIKLAFLNRGLAWPEVGAACELGFGQGLSVNMHAAASVTRWYGNDFNPAQAGLAREMAGAAESGAQLYDDSFAELMNREDLPNFDYIALHGIWSWISDENRHLIVEFIRRKLKVDGVVYISYNALPGWAAFAPMRYLMARQAEAMSPAGSDMVGQVGDAIEFAEKLLQTNPVYARANPQISERVNKLKEQDRLYLAHEYFNSEWHPMHFATVKDWLEPAKLNYACSAYYLDHVDSVNLTSDQVKFLNDIPDVTLRETVRDFMTNQQFRRDYWVKGSRSLSSLERTEGMRAVRVVMVTNRESVRLKVKGAAGEASLNEEVYNPVLDCMEDHKIRTLGEIEEAVKPHGLSLAHVVQATMVLSGAGYMALAQDDETIEKTGKSTGRLNAHVMRKARASKDIAYLASPVTGGAVRVGRFQQLFLLAMSQGKKQPADWAAFAWQLLSAQGQQLVKEGATLQTAEENLKELNAQAEEFAEKQLPLVKALRMI